MGYNLKYNKGEYTPEQFYLLVKEKFHFTGSYKEFISIWEDIFSPNDEIISYYNDLSKRGVKIVLASNTDPIHYQYILKRWGLNFLHSAFLSYEVKEIKPDHSFYHKLIEFGKFSPSNAIFIDDLAENTQSAEECGFNTIHHTDSRTTIDNIERFLK